MKTNYTFAKRILSIFIMLISFQTSFCQLSGTKVIGTAPSDYTTFTAAVADLISNGVNGPVVFNVKAGTYEEQIFIPYISGASATNTITFQSQSGDNSSVDLTYSPSGYADDYTLYLYASNFIAFRNMSISSTGTTYACAIVIDSLAGNNTFSNNVISGYQTSMASSDQALIYSSDFDENNNVFSNNAFNYGSYGIYYYGTALKESGTIITNNIFSDQYYSAIYLSNQNAPVITGNIITTTSPTQVRAMHIQYCDNNMVISKNKISVPASAGGYGMYIFNCESTAGNEALISNNFVQINTNSNSCAGIYCVSSNYQKYFYNSINVTGNYSSSNAFAFEGYGSDGLQIKNNIFSNNANGLAIYCFLSTSLFTSDYNDFYSTGSNLCNYYGDLPTLASWISATSNDSHSKNADPIFVSAYDLHCSAPALADVAVITTDVTDDIDGELRGSTPDIGADEFLLTGINYFSDLAEIKLFPNPASDFIFISYAGQVISDYVIFDICGREMGAGQANIETTQAINIYELTAGIYFLRIQAKDQVIFLKFQKFSN